MEETSTWSRVSTPHGFKMRDLYWLAGWLEGEGSFFYQRVGAVAISAGTTDLDVAQRAAEIMNGYIKGPEIVSGRKPVYRAVVYGWRAAGWMMTLYTLMSGRRKIKIAECLAAFRQSSRRPQRDSLMAECHPQRRHSTGGRCASCASRERRLAKEATL